MRRHNAKGFTLVELAVAMAIIGLLIGGVLKGFEMIQLARAQRVIKDVYSIVSARDTFVDKYAQLPGDMTTATTRVPGCAGGAVICGNGNGNGRIGELLVGALVHLENQSGFNGNERDETSYFFKHLILADLIAGIDPDAPIDDPSYGVTHPAASFSGGYQVTTYRIPWPPPRTMHGLRLQEDFSTQFRNLNGVGIKWAYYIDKKIDDGSPVTGWVAVQGTPSQCDFIDYTLIDLRCVLIFRLDRMGKRL